MVDLSSSWDSLPEDIHDIPRILGNSKLRCPRAWHLHQHARNHVLRYLEPSGTIGDRGIVVTMAFEKDVVAAGRS
jgi:hypothetical protein